MLGSMKMMLVMLMVIGVFGGAFAWYFNHTQQKIEILTANNAKLEGAVATQQKTIEVMQAETARLNGLQSELQGKLQEANEDVRKLQGVLRKHNLTDLAFKKPGLIEKRINAGTQKLFDELETITNNK